MSMTDLRNRCRSPALIVLLLSLVTAGAAAADPPPSPYRMVEAGNAAYAIGDLDAAAGSWERAAATLPNTPVIRHNLGLLAIRRFKPEDAAGHFEHALRSSEPLVQSRVRYSLGVVRHSQALDALQTFQDAKTLLEQATALYRQALHLDPTHADARYNLELAFRMLLAVEQQIVQYQSDARVRDQKTSPNKGQDAQHTSDASRRDRQESDPDRHRKPEDAEGDQTPQGTPSRDKSGQIEGATGPQAMSPEQAEQMIALMRQKAEVMENRRQQWRRSRIEDDPAARNW